MKRYALLLAASLATPSDTCPCSATAPTALVWQPGGTTSGNVYGTQADLQAAIVTAGAWYTVSVDTSLAPAVIMGPFNFASGEWVNAAGSPNAIVTFDNATCSANYLSLHFMVFQSIAGTPFTIGPGQVTAFSLHDDGILGPGVSPSVPLIHAVTGSLATIVFADSVSELEANAITVDEGVFTQVIATGNAGLEPGSLAPGGGGVVDYASDVYIGGGAIGAGWTAAALSHASQTAYAPAVLANWSGTAPTSVANALDRIAAKITPIP